MEFKIRVSELNEETLNSLRNKSLKKLRDSIKLNIPKEKIKLSTEFLSINFDKEIIVYSLYERMFYKYYNGNNAIFNNWKWISSRGLPNNGVKEKIRQLVDEGKKIKTGYTCTKIKGLHDYIIFYK